MANAVTLFNNMPQLPADVEAFFEEESNVSARETIPSLSYAGKTWTISLRGEKTALVRKNAEGDEEPISIMRVVILDYNKRRGRAFYEGAYDPDKIAMPICWSDDGLTPSDFVKDKQSPVCAKCPMSVKGSKVTDNGKPVAACSEHRMVAVIPAARLNFEPLRMKLAITSDWDGQSPDHEAQGWYGFKNYMDMLVAKGVKHTAMLVTKMKFDPNVPYPKVLFAADKWLEPDQLKEVVPVVKSEAVKTLISGTWTPNGVDGVKVIESRETAEGAAVVAEPVDEVAKARAAKAAIDAKAKAAAEIKAKAAEAAEAKAKAAAEAAEAAEAAAAAGQVDDGDDGIELPGEPAAVKPKPAAVPTKAATKPAATKAAAPAAKATPAKTVKPKAAVEELAEEPAQEAGAPPADDGLSDLLSDWG